MAGESEVAAYLSRLTGEAVGEQQPIRLRSVQRAAFASWARQQAPSLRLSAITAGEPFLIGDLFGSADDRPARPALPASQDAAPAGGGVGGIGIDIEEVAALPVADDYREHVFYRENFAAEELAYCIRQADVRAALCGTWAAKEAAIKAGLFPGDAGGLRHVAIARDGLGRPSVAGGQLSISHTAGTADAPGRAVCLALARPGASAVMGPPMVTPPEPPPPAARSRAGLAIAAGVVGVVAGGAISLVMRIWL
jgi:phosphopantetheinyl transferase (holo-ACP synthase)